MTTLIRCHIGMCFILLICQLATGQSPVSAPSSLQPVQAEGPASEQEQSHDAICEMLMQRYILATGMKTSSSDIKAAIQLISSRGRSNGYWKVVLGEFEKQCNTISGNRMVRAKLIDILTRMLTRDGWSRWNEGRDQRLIASPMRSYLGPEVVKKIIAQATLAEDYEIDSYVLAVRQAHDPRSAQFLLRVLRSSNRGGTWSDAKFHAAVGLAELGVYEGVEWLIYFTDSSTGRQSIFKAPHRDATGRRVYKSCTAALADLTGQKELTTQAQWIAWWTDGRKTFVPAGQVALKGLSY